VYTPTLARIAAGFNNAIQVDLITMEAILPVVAKIYVVAENEWEASVLLGRIVESQRKGRSAKANQSSKRPKVEDETLIPENGVETGGPAKGGADVEGVQAFRL
jgi:hypothetical protein